MNIPERLAAGPPERPDIDAALRSLALEGDIAYATMSSPVGDLVIAGTRRGVLRIGFGEEALQDLANTISPRIVRAPELLVTPMCQLREYFEGRRTSFDLAIDPYLIDGFRSGVLDVVRQVPYGQVTTYRDIAIRVDNPRAARAVGRALASNPLPVVIPCHRVVPATGGVGGYIGGAERKRTLLVLEGAGDRVA